MHSFFKSRPSSHRLLHHLWRHLLRVVLLRDPPLVPLLLLAVLATDLAAVVVDGRGVGGGAHAPAAATLVAGAVPAHVKA